MNIDGTEYLDGSTIEFANYDHYPVNLVINTANSHLVKMQKGVLKYDYKTKIYKSRFSWEKVGVGEKEWFITNIVNPDGSRENDYILKEINILNGNNKIKKSKHNILLLENQEVREQNKQMRESARQKQMDDERSAAEDQAFRLQQQLEYEAMMREERRTKGGTRRKRKRKTRYGKRQ